MRSKTVTNINIVRCIYLVVCFQGDKILCYGELSLTTIRGSGVNKVKYLETCTVITYNSP